MSTIGHAMGEMTATSRRLETRLSFPHGCWPCARRRLPDFGLAGGKSCGREEFPAVPNGWRGETRVRGLGGQGFCFAVAALFGFWDLAFGDGESYGITLCGTYWERI